MLRVYCRMDVLSSLATGEQTRLDTSVWLPNKTPQFGSFTVDDWSNHAVMILARVHNFLCCLRQKQAFSSVIFAEWQSLANLIESHEQQQPSIFRPLASIPQRRENTFASTLYISEAVSAAMQMFDLARFFLILARPERSHLERAARFQVQAEIASIYLDRIISNSIVNRHDINWATAVQLLSSAGHALVAWRKRKALLNCLHDIQQKTGWNTSENIENLLDWWGWKAHLREVGQEWKEVKEDIGLGVTTAEALMRMFEWNVPRKSN